MPAPESTDPTPQEMLDRMERMAGEALSIHQRLQVVGIVDGSARTAVIRKTWENMQKLMRGEKL